MRLKRHILAISLMASFASSTVFADNLLSIYQLAVKNDPQLQAAEASFRANIENKNLARAALLPQINAQVYYQDADSDSKRKSADVSFTGSTVIDQTSNTELETESYSVSLNQAIFDLPAWFNFKAGKNIAEQAQAQLSYDQQALMVRSAERYFDVLRAQENLDAALAEERASKRQLAQTKQRFEVGLVAITDVHEAHAVFDATLAQRLGFQGSLAIARENLNSLTGRAHGRLDKLKADFPIVMPAPAGREAWVNFAMVNNYQLKASMASMNSAKHSAKAKKMEHLPKISGSFSVSKEHLDGSSTYNPASSFSLPPGSDNESEALRFTLNMPLFAGGAVSAGRRQAEQQYQAADHNVTLVQRQVITSTRAQHIAVNTDIQVIKARKQSIKSATSALNASQAGYDVGTRNVVDVLDAQRKLYAAVRDHSNARYDYVVNVLKLKQNAGTLSPGDIASLSNWLESSK